ncbi:hypothetical protein mRhiFer1_008262 [Rhinolophus ferrumequinum]|uniref:Uncharacterized protein n=1 Tax=Rhinolophus ferrumequinum TaxID=59479 RepID=A0A7J7VRA3_RHIFE|nr:hypothetical protein mRhiFer1_008262 [Rhinolophus ferrumequinum]
MTSSSAAVCSKLSRPSTARGITSGTEPWYLTHLEAFGLRLNYTTSFPESLACKQQIMGLLSLHTLGKELHYNDEQTRSTLGSNRPQHIPERIARGCNGIGHILVPQTVAEHQLCEWDVEKRTMYSLVRQCMEVHGTWDVLSIYLNE